MKLFCGVILFQPSSTLWLSSNRNKHQISSHPKMFSWQAKKKIKKERNRAVSPPTGTNTALHSYNPRLVSNVMASGGAAREAAAGLTGQHEFREGAEENFPNRRGEASCQRVSKGLSSTHCSNMHLSFRSWPFISAAPDFVYESGWNRLSLVKLGLTVESDSQSCFAIPFFLSPRPPLLPSILHEALTNEWRGRGLKLTLQPRSHFRVHPRFPSENTTMKLLTLIGMLMTVAALYFGRSWFVVHTQQGGKASVLIHQRCKTSSRRSYGWTWPP